MPKKNFNSDIISAAIEGFEVQKRRIDEQIAELRQMQGGGGEESPSEAAPARPRRRLSAAGRKRIAEAARKRWAAIRAAAASTQAGPQSKQGAKKGAGKAGRKASKKRGAQKKSTTATA